MQKTIPNISYNSIKSFTCILHGLYYTIYHVKWWHMNRNELKKSFYSACKHYFPLKNLKNCKSVNVSLIISLLESWHKIKFLIKIITRAKGMGRCITNQYPSERRITDIHSFCRKSLSTKTIKPKKIKLITVFIRAWKWL